LVIHCAALESDAASTLGWTSGVRTVQASDHVHEGGFSGPGRAYNRNKIAFVDIDGNVSKRHDRLAAQFVRFDHIFDTNNRFRQEFSPPYADLFAFSSRASSCSRRSSHTGDAVHSAEAAAISHKSVPVVIRASCGNGRQFHLFSFLQSLSDLNIVLIVNDRPIDSEATVGLTLFWAPA
jgi:hypothetical protein